MSTTAPFQSLCVTWRLTITMVSKPISKTLTRILTPDQVTLLSTACTLTGIALLAAAPLAPAATAGTSLLLMLGYALDSADGQLARLRHGDSKAGEWLDHVADAVKLSTLHGAVAIGLFRSGRLADPALLLLPLAYGAVQNMHFFTDVVDNTTLADMVDEYHKKHKK